MQELLQQIQGTSLSAAIAESTWGFPVIAALHVLAIALFGGAILIPGFRRLKWTGIAVLLATGGLLFWSQPLRFYYSTAFQLKMGLLVLIAITGMLGRPAPIALRFALWAGVILAARGIAFF
jgi:hypothetical protein